jgi:hypothetical protein
MSNTRAYRSKIGRLPFSVRNELNERIRDGAAVQELLSWLNALPEFVAVRAATGCGELNPQNLTDWRGTGYKDWLDEQDKTERLRSLASLSEQIVSQTGGDPAAVGARILTAKLLDALEEADPVTQGELVKSFSILRAGETEARRAQLASEKNELAKQTLALERDKFRRQTGEMILKYSNDTRVAAIAAGPGTNDAKIQALLEFMDREEKSA